MADILADEIESWNGFRDVRGKEDRILFDQMLADLKQFEQGFQVNGSLRASESLFMSLILRQQQIIAKLFEKLAELESQKRTS